MLPMRPDLSRVSFVDKQSRNANIMSLDISKISGMSMVYDPARPILEEVEPRGQHRYTNRSSRRVNGSHEQNTLKLPMIPKATTTQRRIANLSQFIKDSFKRGDSSAHASLNLETNVST